MRRRYRIRVSGKADAELVAWLGRLIEVLRLLPGGWDAQVTLELEQDSPGDDVDQPPGNGGMSRRGDDDDDDDE